MINNSRVLPVVIRNDRLGLKLTAVLLWACAELWPAGCTPVCSDSTQQRRFQRFLSSAFVSSSRYDGDERSPEELKGPAVVHQRKGQTHRGFVSCISQDVEYKVYSFT